MRISILVLLYLIGWGFSGCATKSGNATSDESVFELTVSNQGEDTLTDYGLDVDLVRVNESFILMDGDEEIPVQIEDRNSNGTPDKMFASIDLLPRSVRKLSAISGSPEKIEPMVKLHASLDNATNFTGTHFYNQDDNWSGSGIIMENDWIGFRSIMRPPFAIDIIGKRKADLLSSLEGVDLSEITNWGGDALDERLSLGIGSPALYNFESIIPFTNFDSKEIQIMADGPLRTEIHTTIRGIPVRDEKIDVLVTLQMEAGKHWAQVDVTILSKTDLSLQVAFGLPRSPDATDFTQGLTNDIHFAYTYGLQSAEGEQLGMAIMVPSTYEMDTYRDDPHNYFYLATPANRSVQYRIMAAWVKGRLAIYDEVAFVDLIKKYTIEYGAPVVVKPDFKLQ